MLEQIAVLIAGTLYGLVIGIIPSAGATTGLVALFSFIGYFSGDPYLGVIFCMAVVAASTTGDTFTGVLLGIPGANSAAATMVDGFPLALQGKATYAITAAVTTSTINGILWGTLTFALLPWYAQLMMVFGVPELWAFTMLALATVGFISSKWWVRSLIAIFIGLALGYIGTDPYTNGNRWTSLPTSFDFDFWFETTTVTVGNISQSVSKPNIQIFGSWYDWEYLGAGLQLMPVVAGLFAFPEIIAGLRRGGKTAQVEKQDQRQQTVDGVKAVWANKWDALRGGAIGAFIGLLPGLGGAMSDWMAYGSTVAAHPNEKFGNGNIKGVIGPEGSNNAQKATSMIPTVLFGIPGASFAAVLMGLFMYLDFELGTIDLAADQRFFDSLTFGFMWATVIVGVLCIVFTRYIAMIAYIPYKYYFPLLVAFIVWACVQYTGGWEDYAVLAVMTVIGLLAKHFKFSRPAMLMAFILSDRVESLTIQMTTLYNVDRLLDRPIFLGLCALIVIVFVWGILRRGKLEYA